MGTRMVVAQYSLHRARPVDEVRCSGSASALARLAEFSRRGPRYLWCSPSAQVTASAWRIAASQSGPGHLPSRSHVEARFGSPAGGQVACSQPWRSPLSSRVGMFVVLRMPVSVQAQATFGLKDHPRNCGAHSVSVRAA